MEHTTEEEKGADSIEDMPEHRKFRALLRKVIKAPPLPRKWHNGVSPRAGNPNAPGRKRKALDT